MLIEKRLVTTAVLRPPDVLESREDRLVNHWIEDNRDVERPRFASACPDEEWVRNPVPPRLGAREPEEEGAAVEVKVHVDLRIKEGMEPVIWIECVDAGLP